MKNLFRQHSRVITFLGAVIVFATFVVKDGFRENLKNLTDSIDSAESVFLIRSDLEDIKLHTGRSVAPRGDNPGMFDYAVQDIEHSRKTFDDIAYQLDNIARLIKKLPDQSSQIKFASTWREERQETVITQSGPITGGNVFVQEESKTLAEHWQKPQQRLTRLRQEENRIRRIMNPDHKHDEEAARAAAELSGDSAYLLHVTEAFGRAVLDVAMKAKDDHERSYKMYTYIGYLLYGVGSALGLVGILFGVPGASSV